MLLIKFPQQNINQSETKLEILSRTVCSGKLIYIYLMIWWKFLKFLQLNETYYFYNPLGFQQPTGISKNLLFC